MKLKFWKGHFYDFKGFFARNASLLTWSGFRGDAKQETFLLVMKTFSEEEEAPGPTWTYK